MKPHFFMLSKPCCCRLSVLGFVLLAAALSCACATAPDDSSRVYRVRGSFRTPFQIEINNFAHRQPPAIYVSPLKELGHRPRALFIPFRVVQQIADPVSFADMLSRQFWHVWLSLNAFHSLQYASGYGPWDRARGLALARAQGAELVVGGYINEYVDGGNSGTSSVSLAVEVYDVRSGTQLWSMSQAGLMEARQKHDFYLFSINERNPGDPPGFIVRSIAWDMGHKILAWVDPDAQHKTTESLKDKIFDSRAF
ncbi:MAG: hypothetical protein IJU37_08705 [Desulfovibrio sp.]|nr:hypothetical protein [Desulfovibrio sp.]